MHSLVKKKALVVLSTSGLKSRTSYPWTEMISKKSAHRIDHEGWSCRKIGTRGLWSTPDPHSLTTHRLSPLTTSPQLYRPNTSRNITPTIIVITPLHGFRYSRSHGSTPTRSAKPCCCNGNEGGGSASRYAIVPAHPRTPSPCSPRHRVQEHFP